MMIKCLALVSVLAAMGQAQRPPFAGSRNRQYPEVLPQYLPKENSTTTEPATPSIVAGRLGGQSAHSAPPTEAQTAQYPGSDVEYDKWVATWPRDKQPFRFINRIAIDNHLRPLTQTRILRPGADATSPFAG